MRCLTHAVSLLLAAFALQGLAGPAIAQLNDTSPNGGTAPAAAPPSPAGVAPPLVGGAPFTAALTAGSLDSFLLPFVPPIFSERLIGAGDSAPLGRFIWTGHHLMRVGADGRPLSITDGLAVLQSVGGDAVYLSYTGRILPTSPAGSLAEEYYFTITGGTGRFAAALGSGVITAQRSTTGIGASVYVSQLQGVLLVHSGTTPAAPAVTPSPATTPAPPAPTPAGGTSAQQRP
jgi:hypothetical protein